MFDFLRSALRKHTAHYLRQSTNHSSSLSTTKDFFPIRFALGFGNDTPLPPFAVPATISSSLDSPASTRKRCSRRREAAVVFFGGPRFAGAAFAVAVAFPFPFATTGARFCFSTGGGTSSTSSSSSISIGSATTMGATLAFLGARFFFGGAGISASDAETSVSDSETISPTFRFSFFRQFCRCADQYLVQMQGVV